MLKELYKHHNYWLSIAYTFLYSKEDAEDVVQNMYIRTHKYNIELDKVKYKDGINKYYFYRMLRFMCLDFIKNRENNLCLEEDFYTTNINDNTEDENALDTLFERIDEYVQTWNAYERELFEIVMYSGLSLRDISYGTVKNQKKRKEEKKPKLISAFKKIQDEAAKRGTKISVTSIFHTIKKCKERIKNKFGEDFEDYLNNDYDKI